MTEAAHGPSGSPGCIQTSQLEEVNTQPGGPRLPPAALPTLPADPQCANRKGSFVLGSRDHYSITRMKAGRKDLSPPQKINLMTSFCITNAPVAVGYRSWDQEAQNTRRKLVGAVWLMSTY